MVQNFSALPEVGWNRGSQFVLLFSSPDIRLPCPGSQLDSSGGNVSPGSCDGLWIWELVRIQWLSQFQSMTGSFPSLFPGSHCWIHQCTLFNSYCGWDTNLAAKVEGWSIRSCDHELPVFSFIKNSCVKSTEPQNPQKNWEFLGALCCQKTENWLQSLPLPGVSEMCEKLSNNNSRFKAVKDVVHCIRQRVSRMKTVNCSVHGHPKRVPWHCIKRVSVGAERVNSGTITGQFSAHNTTHLLSKITFSHWRN